VGQPRDGDPRASFGLWDRDAATVTLERVEYDLEAARRDILAAGLPQRLGDRLRSGL
jgi:diadenosine tetraphosphatase ApaH/serine/threonine PP2A family protein phosphatase